MTSQVNYTLCGGTFFTLLLHTRKQRMGVREHYLGKSDGLSDPAVLLGLSKIVAPEWQDPPSGADKTVKANTSRYKSCKAGAGAYFPFEDASAMASFDERIKKSYPVSLAAMNGFVDSFLETSTQTKKDEYLVKALVEVISVDSSISNQTPFYINEDGTARTKQDICSDEQFCFQSFLLGVLHFIIMQRQDNRVGASTYDAWCPPRNGGERLYTAGIGEHSTRNISLTYSAILEVNEEPHESVEEIDVEVVQPVESASDSCGGQSIVNNNPVFNTFNFNGPIGTFNNQVDHITNNYYGGKKDEQ